MFGVARTAALLTLFTGALVLALGVVLCTTRGGAWVLHWAMWDGTPPLQPQAARGAQAIVVPGGRRERVHEAVRIHRATGLPILVAGKGTGDAPFEAESEKMAWILRTQYGLEPRWVEVHSVNTHENAVESWCLLAPQGVTRIVLVTDAPHMVRAAQEFEAAGFSVLRDTIPQPLPRAPTLADFRPSRLGLVVATDAIAEWAEFAFSLLARVVPGGPRCGTGAAVAAAADAAQSLPNRSRV